MKKKGSYKLHSYGYAYIVDKPRTSLVATAEKVYWKCEKAPVCPGRAASSGVNPPFYITKSHNHEPDEVTSSESRPNGNEANNTTNGAKNATLCCSSMMMGLNSDKQNQKVKIFLVIKFETKNFFF